MDGPIRYELLDGVATLTMDDGKANVMNLRMLDALNAALDRASADKAIVVLTGRPGMFSGGFDLSVFKQGDPKAVFEMLVAGARMSQRLLAHPQPVLAACSGHAIAMGLFLLLCADVRVGLKHGATFQANEVQIGMKLPFFALEVCRQRLAPAYVNLVGATAQPYSGDQAVAAGLLDYAVAPESFLASTQEQVARLRKLHPDAFSATKTRLRETALKAIELAIERDIADWSASFAAGT